MTAKSPELSLDDYPLAEKRPDLLTGAGGKGLGDITLETVQSGAATMADLRITPEALRMQAQIARLAGRAALAENFERAAEMTALPQAEIMAIYELLRPGRAKDKASLLAAGQKLRDHFGAPLLARHVEEAAEIYEKRGLFEARF